MRTHQSTRIERPAELDDTAAALEMWADGEIAMDTMALDPPFRAASGEGPADDGGRERHAVRRLVRETAPPRRGRSRRSWLRTLGTGSLLWVIAVIVTGLTGSITMIPTVILLGSFLVPATAVIWYLDHYHSDLATPALAARAFIVGGVCGVLAASLLEAALLGGGPFALFGWV